MQHGLTDDVSPDRSSPGPDTGSTHVDNEPVEGGHGALEPPGVWEERPDHGGLTSQDAPDGLVQQDDQPAVIAPIPEGEAG